MAITDRLRFSLRKQSVVSDAASDSTGHASNSSSKSTKSMNPLKLVKSLTLKSRTGSSSNSSTSADSNNDKSDDDNGGLCNTNDRPEKGVPSWLKKKNQKKERKPVHPSEKPLTLVNIQHQEMLGQFTFTFGTSRASFDERSVNGISPGTSRRPSYDAGSRPLPASSLPFGQSADDQDAQQDHMMGFGRREAQFHGSFLNPESAAYSRRPAMLMVE